MTTTQLQPTALEIFDGIHQHEFGADPDFFENWLSNVAIELPTRLRWTQRSPAVDKVEFDRLHVVMKYLFPTSAGPVRLQAFVPVAGGSNGSRFDVSLAAEAPSDGGTAEWGANVNMTVQQFSFGSVGPLLGSFTGETLVPRDATTIQGPQQRFHTAGPQNGLASCTADVTLDAAFPLVQVNVTAVYEHILRRSTPPGGLGGHVAYETAIENPFLVIFRE
jgi:hypothetical protein